MAVLRRFTALSLSLLVFATALPELKAATDPAAPVYMPPLRGAPATRIGGGVRGPGTALPAIAVLAPDHAGWTADPQPTLYWYLSKQVPVRVELTLIDERGIEPLVEKSLPAPAQAGIQAFSLKDIGVTLKPEQEYRWHVALVVDAKQRSSDVIASGTIRLTPLADTVKAKLAQGAESERPAIYAAEGYWYDAVDALMRLIRTAPEDARLRAHLASLLEQVGITNVVTQ